MLDLKDPELMSVECDAAQKLGCLWRVQATLDVCT